MIEPDERGGDNTIEILGIINTLTEAEGKPFLLNSAKLHHHLFSGLLSF